MKTIVIGKIKLRSYVDNILKDIEKNELKNRKLAAKYLAKELRRALSGRGVSQTGSAPSMVSGNLRKSIGFRTIKGNTVLIGAKKGKGSHAHLLEFGHAPNKSGSKRPFFEVTFRKSAGPMKELLSESWVGNV